MLKQSTSKNLVVFMTDSSDHVTGKTGLTLTVTASKDGAAFASISPTVTELANGWYNLALTTTHTNTLGDLAIHITATGADPSDLRRQVVLDLPGASVSSVTGSVGSVTGLTASNLDATVSSRSTYAGGAVASVTAGVTVTTNNDKTGYGLSAAAIQGIWDALTSALTTVGSIGKLLVTNVDALISSRSTYAGADTSGTTTLLSRLSSTRATALDNLDAAVSSRSTYAGGAVASVTGAVGSVAGNVGGNVVGSVGSVTGLTASNLDAAISTRLASASYSAPDNTSITAIKAKTDNLPSDPADSSVIVDAFALVESDLAALASDVTDVKDKTDQLTFTTANQVDAKAIAVSDKTGYSLASGQLAIKKNTGFNNFTFIMTDSTNHVATAGLTVTATRSIDGGAFASCSNSVSAISGGFYKINLSAADLNGDSVTLKFTATGADMKAITLLTQA